MSYAVANHPVTIAEFDAFVDAQPEETKWELIDGQIVAMTNPTGRHGQIVANLGVALRPAADRAGCRVNFGGMRVQARPDGSGVDKTIPDLTVACTDWTPLATFVTQPAIIVEVLSPSTRDYDRGPKLAFYKSLANLMDIVLIYQDEMRVEHYARAADDWAMTPLATPVEHLALTGLPVSVSLEEIYAGTGLG